VRTINQICGAFVKHKPRLPRCLYLKKKSWLSSQRQVLTNIIVVAYQDEAVVQRGVVIDFAGAHAAPVPLLHLAPVHGLCFRASQHELRIWFDRRVVVLTSQSKNKIEQDQDYTKKEEEENINETASLVKEKQMCTLERAARQCISGKRPIPIFCFH